MPTPPSLSPHRSPVPRAFDRAGNLRFPFHRALSLISPFVHGATGCFCRSPVPFSPGSSLGTFSSFSSCDPSPPILCTSSSSYTSTSFSYISFCLFDLPFRSSHPFFSSFFTLPFLHFVLCFLQLHVLYFFYYISSSSILHPHCVSLFPLRSYLRIPFGYFVIFTSLLLSARFPCSLRRAHAYANVLLQRVSGNILFTPLCLSSLNSAARLSARFLFLFSLRSEPPGVSNGTFVHNCFCRFQLFIFGFAVTFLFF